MLAELRAVAAHRQARLLRAQAHTPPLSPANTSATVFPLPAPTTDAQATERTERTPTVPATQVHEASPIPSPAVITSSQPETNAQTGVVPAAIAPPTLMRKKIHLSVIIKSNTTLGFASNACGTKLWSRERVGFADVFVSNETRAEFDALFTKSVTTTKTTATNTNGKASATTPLSSFSSRGTALIDKRRALNIAILLVGMKLSTDEWRECVLRMTLNKNCSEKLKMLLLAWPTSDEERAIQTYNGGKTLGRAEKFLVGLRDIPRVKQKIACLYFRLRFSTRVVELRESMLLVVRGIHQIMENDTFAAAMHHIFRLCCGLNDGDDASESDARTEAIGLRLSALTQLLYARSFDPAVSVLGAIARAIERDAPRLGMFAQELPLLTKCAAVSVEALRLELASLERGYANLCREAAHAATISLAATTNAQLVEDLRSYHTMVNGFAAEAELELHGLRMNLRDLQDAGVRLNAYLDDTDTTPFHKILTHVAVFVEAYAAERAKIVPTAPVEEERASYSRSRSAISDDAFSSPPSSMASTSTSTLTPVGSDGGKDEA